ncbi:hypothetical protein Nepgr_025835 [Nepenthes gracilis]|uniref:Uncharacterized protein n=1 Tax=Nepenthes gracilis TaxID=150966 RepID=A0AAD3T797_NEPGR|nr:hypothetical protein Nepgr_025835 [Nepenthes gracilis]
MSFRALPALLHLSFSFPLLNLRQKPSVMRGWGEEFITIEGDKVAWLIWIQLLVLFLLSFVLSYFGHFALDFAVGSSMVQDTTVSVNCFSRPGRHVGGYEGVGERAPSTSNRREGAENISERDGSSVKNVGHSQISEHRYNPCHYFELASRAFLGCLGLGSAPRSTCGQENEEDASR